MDTRPSVISRPASTTRLDLSGKNLEPVTTQRLDLSGRNIKPVTLPRSLDLTPCITTRTAVQRNRRNKNKKVTWEHPRKEFKLVKALSKSQATKLDKLRDDLQEAIAKVVRVQRAFVKELDAHGHKANRIKKVAKVIGEVPFHAEYQTKIVSEYIRDILESKAKLAKRRQEEEEKAKKLKEWKRRHKDCIDSDDCSDFE